MRARGAGFTPRSSASESPAGSTARPAADQQEPERLDGEVGGGGESAAMLKARQDADRRQAHRIGGDDESAAARRRWRWREAYRIGGEVDGVHAHDITGANLF